MTRRRNRRGKWISWVLLIFLIVASVICYFVWDSYLNNKAKDDTRVEQKFVEIKNDSEEKSNTAEEVSVNNEERDDKKVIQYEGLDPNTSDYLSGSVTYAGVLNDKIVIRVNIDQYLSNGDCVLKILSNGNEIYSEKTNIINSASTATCEGFDIPFSNIGTGNYEIEIKMFSDDKSGIIRSRIDT